jgi:sugar fermentation stimulation protein A
MFSLPEIYFGEFVRRYKRFFIDIQYNDEIITAHNPNTGSMRNLLKEGRTVAFSKSNDPKRKLKYTVEGFCIDGTWIYTNTIKVNKIVENAVRQGEINFFAEYEKLTREYTINDSKIDFCIHANGKKHLVEVKSVSLFDDTYAMFPDAVTKRGQKHLKALIEAKKYNYESGILYIIQSDREKFRCADEIDSDYCSLYRKAVQSGVNVLLCRNVMDIENKVCYLKQLNQPNS